MQAALQIFLDELTQRCRENVGEFWKADAQQLAFVHDWETTSCALQARVEIATGDDMLVSATWAWRDDDGIMHVGQSLRTIQRLDGEVSRTLDAITQELPVVVTGELLRMFD